VVNSNANVTISSAGTANVLTVSSTGTVTIGTASVTGNLTTGNINTTGNVTGGNIVTTGQVNVNTLTVNGESTFTGNLLPSANVTYNLGSPTQRWKEIFLAANTIDIGGALISADLATGSLILTGPDGAEFILSGTSPTTSVGQFGMIQISNTMSSHDTTTGALTVVGGAGIGGNINVGGVANIAGNILTQANISVGGSIIVNSSISANGSIIANSNLFANAIVSAAGNVVGSNVYTGGQVSATGNITGGNLITGAQVLATGNITGSNIVTAGQILATGNIVGSTLIASGNIVVQSRQQVKFYDTDNSNFISLRAPNALTGDYLLTLPTSYGNADQVLSTNGAGILAWADQTGGGGGSSATSYPNSTVSPVPGSTGNFDLSFNFVQTSQEVPFESSATDAFGVNLGEVYSMMDPGGEVLEPVDLGPLT